MTEKDYENYCQWIVADAAMILEKVTEHDGVIWFYNLDGTTEASWCITYNQDTETFLVQPIKYNKGCEWTRNSVRDLLTELWGIVHRCGNYNSWFTWDD